MDIKNAVLTWFQLHYLKISIDKILCRFGRGKKVQEEIRL